jgi:spermidine synthase
MPATRTDATARRACRALPLLVAVSGASALVYESLWMRSFGLIFGGTTSAVAMVLAVFMGGMALGSALAARGRAAHPLRAYARVELAIGAAALLSLPLLRALPWAYGALVTRTGLTGAAEQMGITGLAALVLLPPTVLLGTTVPLAVEFLSRAGTEMHAGFGRLYLLNTLGGAVGVALAPFVLVPALGVRGTLVSAAAGSLFVGGVTGRWARTIGPLPASGAEPIRMPGGTAEREGRVASPLGRLLAFASGAATFGVEVLWTRSYALVIGSSVYAFNAMLLAVLIGIGLGAGLYGRWRGRISRPAWAVGLLFVGAGVAMLAGQWAIGLLPIAYLAALGALPVSFATHQFAGLTLCLATMLPVTVALGLTFPLLLHLDDPRGLGVQRASGRLYASNTAGAIAGALGADLLLVKHLGLQPPYLVFAGLLLVSGAWALAVAGGWTTLRRAAAVIVAAGGLAALVPHWKPWDPVLMASGVHRYGLEWAQRLDSAGRLGAWLREQRTLLFYREGVEAVIAVQAPRGSTRRFLSINGKTDAGSGAEDVVQQKFLAHVPMLLHPAPRRVLVIGWGSGATAASAALHGVASLECVEIEPSEWDAAPFFADLSGQLKDDPRFRIVFRDARNHILRSHEAFDVIVSEPSNAWISGVSNLFTLEFHEAALGRLAPGGILAQWFHYYSLEPADVKVELKTFLSVFPHVSLWLAPPVGPAGGVKSLGADLLLVGSREPHRLDWVRLERAFASPDVGGDLRATGVFADALTLAATWTMGRAELQRWVEDERAFPSGTPLNTDDHPYIEFVSPRRNVMAPSRAARLAAAQYSAMGEAGGDLRQALSGAPSGGAAESAFLRELAERYVAAVQPERALRALDAAVAADPGDAAAYARAGELLLDRGRPAEAEKHLAEAVRLDPGRARAWEALGELALDRHDYARAEEAHRALLRLQPGNVAAWLRLGAVLARQQRWHEARDALGRARALDPKAPVDPQLLGFLDRQIRSVARPRP